jgi:hypothetical protein
VLPLLLVSDNGSARLNVHKSYIFSFSPVDQKEKCSFPLLNILYIERKNKRERESGSVNTQWTTLYCVVIDRYEYNNLLI